LPSLLSLHGTASLHLFRNKQPEILSPPFNQREQILAHRSSHLSSSEEATAPVFGHRSRSFLGSEEDFTSGLWLRRAASSGLSIMTSKIQRHCPFLNSKVDFASLNRQKSLFTSRNPQFASQFSVFFSFWHF
jgi:hypothetical protein